MSRLRPALAFTAVVGRSLARDRTSLFFTLVLPVAVIVIIGTVFGGQPTLRLGVVTLGDGPLATRFVAELGASNGIEVVAVDGEDELDRAVRRRDVGAGLAVPATFDADVAAGRPVELAVLGTSDQDAVTAWSAVGGVAERLGARFAAATAIVDAGGPSFDAALAAVDTAAASASAPPVVTEDVGTPARELSRFSLTAPQNLVLFTFINSIASAAFLVQTRRSGVLRRALSSPVPLAVQLAGLALGWFAFALVQSLAILAIGAVVFGVDWGDPVAAAVLLLAFAAVACGAGLLVGAIGNDPDRVGSISPFVGIVLGALGGCMVPLEVFPPAMSTIARFTPHYWALTSWQRLVFDGEGLGAVLPGVGVLLGVAAALLGLATVLTRRRLVQA